MRFRFGVERCAAFTRNFFNKIASFIKYPELWAIPGDKEAVALSVEDKLADGQSDGDLFVGSVFTAKAATIDL